MEIKQQKSLSCYLDYNATTPPSASVINRVQEALKNNWGNPSSSHVPGLAARETLQKAREEVAGLLGVDSSQVIFTSGGTEANGLALWSAHLRRQGKRNRIIVSAVEHASVLEAARRFSIFGDDVQTCRVDGNGRIDLEMLSELVDEKTFLVAVMYANNEVGTVQPVKEAAAIARGSGALFLSDGVQALEKIPVPFNDLGVDYMSFSAHKIYGPKGVGCLCVKHEAPVCAPLRGGGQEGGARSGTENIPGIAGFGEACRQITEHPYPATKIREMRDRIASELVKKTGADIVGDMETGLSNTLGIIFRGVDSQAMLLSLSRRGVYVSAGSACNTGKSRMSHVLKAMGISRERASSFIRISIGVPTNDQEIQFAISEITREAERLSGRKD